MPTLDLDAQPSRSDVINAYRLALGRDPESEAVIEERFGQRKSQWLPPFFTSDEFRQKVRDKILGGGSLHGGHFDEPPAPELMEWAAKTLPLSQDSRKRVRRAASWPDLFALLFADNTFLSHGLGGQAGGRDAGFLRVLEADRRLTASSRIMGEVELSTDHEVRGWVVNGTEPDRPLNVELRINGTFVAGTTANDYRHDLQERFGGQGHFGFRIHCSGGIPARAGAQAELRDAATGVRFASFVVEPKRQVKTDAIADIRREIADLRALLDRIESKLPAFHASYGFSLDSYDCYFQTYLARQGETRDSAKSMTTLDIVVDASRAPASSLDLALASVANQTRTAQQIIILCRSGDGQLAIQAVVDRWRGRMIEGVQISILTSDGGTWSDQVHEAMLASISPNLLLFPADARLAPSAVERVDAALSHGALIVSADEDVIESGIGMRPDYHLAPRLRGAFDYDLLLQEGLSGSLLGLARGIRDLFPKFIFKSRHDLALQIYEQAGEDAFEHLPQILLHHLAGARSSDMSSTYAERMEEIAAHLARTDSGARVEVHDDVVGASLPQAYRIRFPVPPRPSIAIIIPTRDRLDLLGPCLASIAASLLANQTKIEILVVDNRSQAAATRAFLDAYATLAELRVIDHDDTFNWALMNNRSAEQTDASVLVFLNNDTIVLSKDCWDELAAQASRRDVGAVGARLLYEDGTIQHAGMVMDAWHSFASHEGVGDPASDAGYLGRHALVRQVSTVTGACLATRRDLFLEHGGFDADHFPVEGNDTDYCLRLRSRGLKILYDPFATLYHLESKSRGYNDNEEKRRRAYEATSLLRERWSARFQDDPFYNPHFDRLSPPFSRLQPPPR